MSISVLWRRAAALVAAVVFASVLSGCMLTSDTMLVSDDEATLAFGDGFTMVAYQEADGGALVPGADRPPRFKTTGNGYVDDEGEMTVYFVPLEEDLYLLAVEGPDGGLYGIARHRTGVLELRVVFDADPEAQLMATGDTVPDSVAFAEGGASVGDRAGLDAMIALMRNNRLTTAPLVAWVGSDPPPARLVPEGDWYRVEN